MIHSLPTLYKRDSKGKVREWTMQYMGPINPGTRTVSGLQNGKLVESGWNKSYAKNVGRSNATTDFEQAQAEAKAKWDINLDGEYFEHMSEIDSYDKFKPQLARDYTKLPQDYGYSQPKLDGIRCIARKDGLYTRAGKAITTCDHIHEALKPVFAEYPEIILDGELYNHQLKADFNKITSLVRKVKPSAEEKEDCEALVQYHVYDCVDATFTEWAFIHRMKFIDIVIDDNSTCVEKVPTSFCKNQDQLDTMYSKYMKDGYEGQMVRNDAPYENKRSKNLLKRKEFITEEFNVIEVMEGKGNWAGYAKHFKLELGDGREFKSGVRGNFDTLEKLLNGDHPNWVTCRYFEKTPDGIPRFPVVIDWGTGERTD